MTALERLVDPGMLPFTGALMFVAGLLILELIMSVLGGSLMGGTDTDADFDVDAGMDADFDADFDGDIADALDTTDALDSADGLEADVEGMDASAPGGIAAWLGFGEVPFILWVAGLLTAFGLTGYGLQTGSFALFGGAIPAGIAAIAALIPALWLGRWFARTLGRLVPKTETTAIRRRSLGGRRGIIAQGTARRGNPAQARIRDGYGNLHYVRVEPVDDIAIPQGTEVMIRGGRGPILQAIPLDDVAS